MSRGLSGTLVTQLETGQNYVFNLIEIIIAVSDTPTTYRYTTAHMDLVYDSNTYTATNGQLGFGSVNEKMSLEVSSMSVSISSVDQSMLAIVLNNANDVVNGTINLYRGVLNDSTYAIIDSPILLYSGYIKGFTVNEDVDSSSVMTFATGSKLSDFERTSGRRTNQQDQDSYLTDKYGAGVKTDTAFSQADKINGDIVWGRGYSTPFGG